MPSPAKRPYPGPGSTTSRIFEPKSSACATGEPIRIWPLVPRRQRASDASLLRRLESAVERVRCLETENERLRDALALALGERRASPWIACGMR
jgi:hypothetical protein